MDEITKTILLTQIGLAQGQLAAIQSMILAVTAPAIDRPMRASKESHTISDKIDEEIGAMFESIKPHPLDEGDK